MTNLGNGLFKDLITPDGSKIITYSGKEGLEKVTLNSLEAKTNLCIYEIRFSMNPFVDKKRADEIRREFMRRNIKTREITNQPYREQDYTDIPDYDKLYMDYRYIDPKKVKIDMETLIYNDVVAFYTYVDKIFITEIHNEKLAKMQRQIFDYIWQIAEKPVVGKGGRSSLI